MINTNNLVTIHDTEETIHRHKRILKDLFYLCINKSFLNTIVQERQYIQQLFPENIELPITDVHIAIELRNACLNGNSNDYQNMLMRIREHHNYYHPAFTRNYSRISGDFSMSDRFNILENILFYNDPFPDVNQSTIEYFNNISGSMEIEVYEETPYISMQFDIGTTKGEIKDVIDKLFPEIALLQEELYGIPNKQYRKKENLRIKEFIHIHSKKTYASIAVKLEKTGLAKEQDNYDYIRMHKQRIEQEITRFDPND